MVESTAQPPKTEPSDTPDNMSAEENTVPTQDQALDSVEEPLRSDEEDGRGDDGAVTSDHQSGALVNGYHHETEGTNVHAGDEEDGDGLFGSASEAEDAGPLRKLDDEELDSGDDEERNDRLMDDADGDVDMGLEGQSANIMDVKLGRHAVPDPSDGELYLLKFPNFLGLEPKIYRHEDFQPPVTDHHSTGPPSSTFSPYSTAISTIRWRRSPRNPSRLQSNARILRWSDGSLTMQLASNATEQLELPAKPLAPPQRNPLKPTPTAINRGRATNGDAPYNPQLESHTYLTTPHESASFLRVTNHITNSLTVLPSSDQNDDALIRLQESLAAAVRGSKTSADGGVGLISISEDPELAKKKAEVAEREKMRAQRRRQQQEERERDRANRVLGKSGLRSSGGVGGSGGLTVGGLEDDDGMATTRARHPSKPKRKPRRNSEYSDDEDGFRNRGRTREDEYDEDDGFLVRSDEEPEVVEESEDEDEGLGDADGEGVSEDEKPKKKKSPKRERERAVETVETGEDGGVAARGKRRKVVEEEEDE